jgi:hypothetical protein
MPWLPIYADSFDFEKILGYLNASEELAFIVTNGLGRWIAVPTVHAIESSTICLWHVPSGPLPLLHPKPSKEIGSISDPWAGWEELRAGADSSKPYFGAGHSGIIWLNVRPKSRLDPNAIGLSSFEWIGNHYWAIGQRADESTEKFWRNMRRWVQKSTIKIPRSGPLDGPHAEVFAFPSAVAAFNAGTQRAGNPE